MQSEALLVFSSFELGNPTYSPKYIAPQLEFFKSLQNQDRCKLPYTYNYACIYVIYIYAIQIMHTNKVFCRKPVVCKTHGRSSLSLKSINSDGLS